MRARVGMFALAGCLLVGSASAWPFPVGSEWPQLPSALPPVAWLPPPPLAVPGVPTPPIALGAITRGPDYALKPKAAIPKVTAFTYATPHVKFAPDQKSMLLHSKVTRVGSETNATGVQLGTVRAYRSAWSSDSKHVVLSEESRTLTVWKSTGALVRKIDNAFGAGKYNGLEVGFPEANVALYHDGCRLNRLDITSPLPPVRLGQTDVCGRVYVSKDGKRWVVLEEGSKSYGLGLWYVRATSIDTTTGTGKAFLDSSKVQSWTDV